MIKTKRKRGKAMKIIKNKVINYKWYKYLLPRKVAICEPIYQWLGIQIKLKKGRE